MNYIPSIGDLLIRPKYLGLVQHEGVVVGHNAVFHNIPGRGEHVSTLDEFAAGQDVTAHQTGADPNLVLSRLRDALAQPKPYHPLLRNCQHSAAALIKGVAKSPLAIAAGILIVGLILWAMMVRR